MIWKNASGVYIVFIMIIKSNVQLFYNTTDFPLRVSLQEKQDPTKLHSHECVELVCVYDGEGMHLTEVGQTPLRQGDVFVIPRGLSHGYLVEKKLSLYNVLFMPERLPMPQLDLCQMAGFQELFMPLNGRNTYPFFHISEEELSEVMPLLKELLAESRNFAPACRTCRLGLLMVLLCKLTRLYCVRKKVREHIPEGVNKVLEYLNLHFRETVQVDSLPKMSRMSRSNFLRAFKQVTGTTPLQYVLHLRINYACRELQESEGSVTEIAYQSGFEDSNYFSRIFHKFIGMTPREYRSRIKFSQSELPAEDRKKRAQEQSAP